MTQITNFKKVEAQNLNMQQTLSIIKYVIYINYLIWIAGIVDIDVDYHSG